MINYSIVLRTANSNAILINAAKARIRQAKEAGQTPDSADVALANTEYKKAFAQAQCSDVVNLRSFARHIANHGCVYSRADIDAILTLAVDCLQELLLQGKKVQLGELGSFYVTLESNGAESAAKFTSACITRVKTNWDRGADFQNMINDATFNLVASRQAQKAALKALKEDGSAPTPDGNPTPGGSTGGSTSGGSTGGSTSGSSTPGGSTGGGSDEIG